jgi:hypothetical protein
MCWVVHIDLSIRGRTDVEIVLDFDILIGQVRIDHVGRPFSIRHVPGEFLGRSNRKVVN